MAMNTRLIILTSALLSLVSVGIAGFLHYESAKLSAWREAEQHIATHCEMAKLLVRDTFAHTSDHLRTLGGFDEFRDALLNPGAHTRERAERILDHCAQSHPNQICYLLDKTGVTVASSNRGQPDSFVGHNYGFRPYFKDAMAGKPGIDMAVGITSGERGLFFSCPVRKGPDEAPLGVVAVKGSVGDLERRMAAIGEGTGLLLHQSGLIFASTREDWVLRTIWRESAETLASLKESKQFGPGPWPWIGLERSGDGRMTDRAGERYLSQSREIEEIAGWSVLHLEPLRAVTKKIIDPLTGLSLFVAVGLFLIPGTAIALLYVAAQRDLGRRNDAERRLRESETTLRTVLQAAPIGIGVTKKRVLGWTNHSVSRISGYVSNELEGRSARMLYPDDEEFDRVGSIQYGAIKVGGSGTMEARWRRKDGRIIDVLLSSVALDRDDLSAGVVFAVIDITHRKLAEQMLKDREEMLSTILDASPIGIGSIAPDRTILWVNRSWLAIFGYADERELVGRTTRNLYPSEEEFLRVGELVLKNLGHTRIIETEAKMRKKSGELFDAHCRFRAGDPLEYDKGIIQVLEDVTRRNMMEREQTLLKAQFVQAQKMEAVGTLAGGVAHDFNNLLQVVLGFSEIALMECPEGDSRRASLETIIQAAKTGADLVRRLLMFSRKSPFRPKPLNLNHEVRQVVALLARTIPRTIDLQVVEAVRPPTVHADPTQVEQVLLNLAVNARDAMPGGGTLTIEISDQLVEERFRPTILVARPGRYACLTVSDTGEGMTAEVMERIFEPFFTTKPVGRGTGLGLAGVYGIVEQHGGFITCDSELGVGTTFRIFFPAMEHKVEAPVPLSDTTRCAGGTETVLVVDDEAAFRDLAKRILAKAGYRILIAADGREALEAYRTHRNDISLVILDLLMPVMDGSECLKELMRINPDVKVLVASGYGATEDTMDSMRKRTTGFIAKPFDFRALLRSVREAIDETPAHKAFIEESLESGH